MEATHNGHETLHTHNELRNVVHPKWYVIIYPVDSTEIHLARINTL